MRRLSIILFASLALFSCKKEGCTDPKASNYNPEAKKDDGSCIASPAVSLSSMKINIDAHLGQESFAYNQNFMTPDSTVAYFTLVQFYLSYPQVKGSSPSTSDQHYLVKLNEPSFIIENLTGGVADGIAFTFGVDSLTNNTKQPVDFPVGYPLASQNPSMHWGWAAKYQFIKLEGMYDSDSDGTPDAEFQYHMGSDAYSRMISYSFSPAISLKAGEEGSATIKMDVKKFFEGLDIKATPKSHMTNATSNTIMANLEAVFQ